MITLRQATLDDIDAMTSVEVESWPSALAVSQAEIESRVRIYPAGQWVACRDGQPVGAAYAQRVSGDLISGTPTWQKVTDSGSFATTHDPAGEVYLLVSVGVTLTGHRIGRKLIDRQIDFARGLEGVERIVGFTRPALWYRFPEKPIDDYVHWRNEAGRIVDPVLSFHVDAGARVVSVHPEFRPEDVDSRGCGVLIEYSMEV